MPGMNGFVTARNSTPPPGQGNHPDRNAAQGLKFKPGQSVTNARLIPQQRLSSTAPALGYASNDIHDIRKIYPAPKYTRQEHQKIGGLGDDTTVGSDFDETRSDITLGQNPIYDGQEDGRSPLSHENLQYYENAQQLAQSHQTYSHAISGRFHGMKSKQHLDVSLRPGDNNRQQVHDSRKRGPSNEPTYESSLDVPHQGDKEYEEGSGEDDEEEVELGLHGPGGLFNSDPLNRDEDVNAGKLYSDGADPNALAASQSRQFKSQVEMNAKISPDYTEDELKDMNYSKLKAESWETIPNPPEFIDPEYLQGPDVTLEARIDYYAVKAAEKPQVGENGQLVDGFEAQWKFYTKLSKTEWEQAGDFLLDKFSNILQKLKTAKQDKRKMVERFEAEVEAREKAVRGKSEKLEAEFNDMKANGEELLRGKISNPPAL